MQENHGPVVLGTGQAEAVGGHQHVVLGLGEDAGVRHSKELFCSIREGLGSALHKPVERKHSKIPTGHLLAGHVHILIPIPPKIAVPSVVVGYMKGKSAIYMAGNISGHRRNFTSGGEIVAFRRFKRSVNLL
ncbi:transposase [uncultured Desulfovibrio sp.]|uniref:transposase n=1 Tax=uncultured Desulfovibrio sp. TaxID=167968 RepID=UPI002615DEB4|nr:transposase [uncultured Desulfovibrio sp.]